ncbi:hypothetical protein BDC45DRAFT_541332 [Circinella umbellata]|nr:hypothetical protein BDC45DRAFT_541332 [Circinella umbellata]
MQVLAAFFLEGCASKFTAKFYMFLLLRTNKVHPDINHHLSKFEVLLNTANQHVLYYLERAKIHEVDLFNIYAGGSMFHTTAVCEILQDEVLQALGNIKTLSSVYIESTPLLTLQGINRLCEQLNVLPGLFSIELSDIPCVNDSTLFILGLSSTAAPISHNITKRITLNSLRNVTKKGLDQLAKKQGVSLISNDCPGTINSI